MASISITDPTPDSTVGWTFTASGGYTTTPGHAAGAGDDTNEVQCTLYDSGGQPIQVRTFQIVGRVPPPTGLWEVEFSVNQDYAGCSITAELLLANVPPPPPSDTVGGINVTAGAASGRRSRDVAHA
jgi:hypothetical protein